MYYFLLILGATLSFLGARWAVLTRNNPPGFLGRSQNTEAVLSVFKAILFPGSYLIMLFAHGVEIRWLVTNALIVLIFHFVISPVLTAITLNRE